MQAETQEMLQPRVRAREPQVRVREPGSRKRPPPEVRYNPHKPARLKKAREFQHVRQQGRSAGTALLTLGWAVNDLTCCRTGYAVGKRVGGAVIRNRIKRRLREIIRLQITAGHLTPGYDLVFIARPGAAQASSQQLATDVIHLLHRAHLWHAAPPEGLVPP
jgi:ribonuclease P protein component